MSLGQARKAAGRIAPPGRKTLALVGALVLSVFAFVLTGREAQAQQLPQVQQEQVVATDLAANPSPAKAHPAEESPAEAPPIEPVETSPARISLSDKLTLPVSEPADPSVEPGTASQPESAVQPEPASRSEPAYGQNGRYDPEATPLDAVASTSLPEPPVEAEPIPEPDAAPPTDQSSEPIVPESAPLALEHASEPELEPVAFEENEPLSPRAEEVPALEPLGPDAAAEFYPPPSLGDSVSGAVGPLESVAIGALNSLTSEVLSQPAGDGGLSNATLTGLFSVEEAPSAPVGGPAADPEPSSTGSAGSESPLRDTPQPSAPFAPPVGSSSSLSGSSAIGSVGVALLLLCILTSGVILLRRDGQLLLAFCELPKPRSALRLPRERPG